jgi:hypothetical protein
MINKIDKERESSMNTEPHTTQQQETIARSPGRPQTKTGHGRTWTGKSPK